MLYFAFLIPLFIALIYLLTALAFKTDSVFYDTFWFDLAPLALVVASIIWLYRKFVLRRDLSNDFWLYLCFLAPFALWYPWVITSGSTDPGYGGFLYFMEWLTKNPNLGAVNLQVLIGIICMITTTVLPPVYAFHALSDKPHMSRLLLLFSICLIAFMPVFIRLDLMLWITGFGGGSHPAGASEGLHGLDLAYGPLLHTAPMAIMSWHVISALIKKPANYY
jgi:hypothetical protein